MALKEKTWKQEEVQLLKEAYPHYENHELVEKFFPNRTLSSLYHKANRLGLHKTPETRAKIIKNTVQIAQRSNFTGKTHNGKGYVVLTQLGGGNRVLEHRFVAEQKMGRKLKPDEVVFHKNGIKTDNRPENLEIVSKRDYLIMKHNGEYFKKETKQKLSDKAKERFSNPVNHPSWKGGKRTNSSGYVELLMPEHPRARGNGYVFEHIVIAENILQRPLTNKEVIHHINGNKSDNRIENLVLTTRGYHSRIHARPKAGVYLICPICGNTFYVKPSHISKRVTCSSKCAGVLFAGYYTNKPRDYRPTQNKEVSSL